MNNTLKMFFKYTSLNILGMLGVSVYILADTYFISRVLGTSGIAALNLALPIFSIIHGSGLMLAMGGSTRFSILKARGQDRRANGVFALTMKMGIIFGVIFILIGVLFTEDISMILGASPDTFDMTVTYMKTMFVFAPAYIMSNILVSFARNSKGPKIAMNSMLVSSFSNIILDYVFMLIIPWGMFGAAFATSLAPIISIGILAFHNYGEKFIEIIKIKVKNSYIFDILKLGTSALVIELSSAISLIVFNLLILGLEGDYGLASYGIVANLALVSLGILTGLTQGTQPLISSAYGRNDQKILKKINKYGIITSLSISIAMYLLFIIFSTQIIAVFNTENVEIVAMLTENGIMIYFLGFIFAGVNMYASVALSSMEAVRKSFTVSILRGFLILVPFAIIFAKVLGMNGIWMSFIFTEAVVLCFSGYFLYQRSISKKLQSSQYEHN